MSDTTKSSQESNSELISKKDLLEKLTLKRTEIFKMIPACDSSAGLPYLDAIIAMVEEMP